MKILFLVLLFTLVGTFFGTVTGLIPGLHVNTVALLLISSYPILLTVMAHVVAASFYYYPVFTAVLIVSTSITHTFLDFVPSTFLGVPEGETALSVLPAHSLLLKGQGYHAVRLSAVGSSIAVMFAFITLFPFSWLLGEPVGLYSLISENVIFILFFLTALLLSTETAKFYNSRIFGVTAAFLVFILSGNLGIIVLSLPSHSPFGLFSTVLFPLFSGLFGISTLALSLNEKNDSNIPHQEIENKKISTSKLKSSIPGSAAGSVVGFLPGVSAAHAAIISLLSGKKEETNSTESVIITLGAVNTSNAIFVLVALYLTGRSRSGAAVAVQGLVPSGQWTNCLIPYFLVIFLIAVIGSSLMAFFITLFFGKIAAGNINRISYEKLVISIIVFIIFLVFVFNGFLGLAIVSVAGAIGMIPPLIGVRRSHLMGVLLVPVMLYFI